MYDDERENYDLNIRSPEYFIPGVRALREMFQETRSSAPQIENPAEGDPDLAQIFESKQIELERLLEDLQQIRISIRVNASEIIALRDRIEDLQRQNTGLRRNLNPEPLSMAYVDRFLTTNDLPEFDGFSLKELIVKLSVVF
jgi:hypothetical protein